MHEVDTSKWPNTTYSPFWIDQFIVKQECVKCFVSQADSIVRINSKWQKGIFLENKLALQMAKIFQYHLFIFQQRMLIFFDHIFLSFFQFFFFFKE